MDNLNDPSSMPVDHSFRKKLDENWPEIKKEVISKLRRRFSGSLIDTDYEDVLHSALLDLLNATDKGATIHEVNDVKRWLLVVARRRAIDKFRREARIVTKSRTEFHDRISLESDFSEEDIQKVRFFLGTLPPEEFEVLEKRFYQGLTFRQIATELHLSISETFRRCASGIARLREKFGLFEE